MSKKIDVKKKGRVMDAKKNADLLRKAADKGEELADLIDQMDVDVPGVTRTLPRALSRQFRKDAEELDPSSPEWENGDLALDREGGLWEYDGELWNRRSAWNTTDQLEALYGPIQKVHIANPAKQEVVISLDEVDRESLAAWGHPVSGSARGSVRTLVAHRAAQAAREQLKEEI